jgi:hypothetical protein
MGGQEMYLTGKLPGKRHIVDHEADGRITLRWVSGAEILRMAGGCN